MNRNTLRWIIAILMLAALALGLSSLFEKREDKNALSEQL